ncbi:MAG TPA: hypothetical protein VHA52_07610 [Candidatus Babeliaceae bacterium]|nr:hypothetical protein [Candidatus Babeliaceae bacterium]
MLSSVLQKPIKLIPFIVGFLLLSGFRIAPDAQQMLAWSNQTLTRIYDPSGEKLKKWELNITDDFFLRFRKTYTNGKQEYFSCQLHNFNDVDYNGTESKGTLTISTKADDIIVQTYNDRKGNIDSMTTSVNIPVKNLEPEQLDSLRDALLSFKDEVRP